MLNFTITRKMVAINREKAHIKASKLITLLSEYKLA